MRPFSSRGSLLFSVVIAASLISHFTTFGQVLTPPYFNLAEGRRINASATCGEGVPEPELYCKLVGADVEKDLNVENLVYQGQFCDYCDPKSALKKHPAEYAVDGRKTWWQSPPLSRGMSYNEVNLTVELGQEFHVAYVIVKMGNSPRPRVWVLERSSDNGQTYSPWQYFADSPSECRNFFGPDVDFQIKADDSVICSWQFSKIVPLEGGEIVVPLVQNRPSANDFFNSTVLQEWTRATNVRFRLLGVKNLLGHLMSIARQDVTTTRRYYYSIEDISIGGRCRCNGHADTCTADDENDPFKRVCDCKDNTCGRNCEYCCPGFEQKKWSQSKNNKRFICERCNCFGHSDQCVYNETVDNLKLSSDLQGNYEGGGVCQNCQHNTEGYNCNKCVNGYYRPYGKNLSDIDVCQKCRCEYAYSTGNCEDGTGKCECKPEFTKPNCDSCSFGHYGYPLCRPCDCYINGTTTLQCQADNGRCSCKFNYGGDDCRICAEKFYSFPECKPCDCHSIGSASNVCDLNSGDCKCLSNFGGRTCNECRNGYHSFPTCSFCNCDVKGTLAEICDKSNGKCLCKPGYGGARCDYCVANFTGFPDCKPCNCSSIGSTSTVCDTAGRCTCFPNFSEKLCDKCAPGFYNYPNCIPCNCNRDGSNGLTCNNDGSCICKPNFSGIKCEQCNIGYYNFPTCEKCSFNPAGVISSFTSCPADLRKIDCKANVLGRECSECKELFWNLKSTNPVGCEDCDCNLNGTVGKLGTCDMKTGQCFCKAAVTSRQCSECSDGYYGLSDTNLFGCTDCDCDVGGAVSNICDKRSGQCVCQPRVVGRNCKEALTTSYFPTLHQYQYEIEDGVDPEKNPVSYAFDEAVFPGYSWKGYAVFSQLQSETNHDILVDKPSIYRIILRYINLNNQAISGEISVSPESSNTADSEQKFEVLFKPSKTPSFVTVAGINGNNPSPFVLNPGPWIVKIKTSKNLFLDYFVLIPAEYYEATALVVNITAPCSVDKVEICRQYVYPNISSFDQTKASGGYINTGGSRSNIQLYLEESEDKFGKEKMAVLSDAQPELTYDMTITRPGLYVVVIIYATTKDRPKSTIEIDGSTQLFINRGTAAINNCRYSTLCRAVAVDRDNKVAIFNLDSNNVKFILKGAGDGIGIESVVPIPVEKWSLDYIQPKPSCIKKDNICFSPIYSSPPESKRIDFKTGNENRINATLPSTIFDNTTELVFLDYQDAMVDVSGKVAKAGPYVFVVHYYQPDFPEFEMDVIVQNGHFYEAQLPVKHCPSVSGCRSVIRQANANNIFQLTENFVLTLKEPNHKSIWLHYLLVIPSSQYNPNIVNELPFDLTASFISQCGQNHFYIDHKEEAFCKEAVFSLSTKYNHGTIPCQCDFEGSMSFECEKFGGQCPCHKNIVGRRCDTCKTGYFGFPHCQSCNCSTTAVCDTTTGECQCPRNVHGEKCNKCIPYTYGFDPIHGCRQCNCNIQGVKWGKLQCNDLDGSCDCKEHVEGRTCDRCSAGYYQFPICEACECDLRGTTEDICNQTSAACFCKNNVHGSACDVCKDGTFNLQAENAEGCTKCFCFGRTTRCSSSVLFTKNVSVYENWSISVISQSDSVNVEPASSIVQVAPNNISLTVGATAEGIAYFSAPKEFLGNKLTSYGNYLAYTVLYDGEGDPDSGANVILFGAKNYLLYYTDELPVNSVPFEFSVKIVESNFRTISGLAVTREEMMQVLQNLTGLYIKATYAKKGSLTTISKISIEVATSEYHETSNVASAVEKCQCPPSYMGLSCEECADGFYRVPNGPFGGYCVPCQCNGHSNSCDKTTGICHNCKHNTKGEHCEKCEMGYYGNATVGTPNDCLICACPLPVQSNNFATGCDINDLGDKIICDCISGYAGARCERCGAGFYGRPEVTGEVCVSCQCNGNIDPSDPEACDHMTGKCLKCLNNTYGDSCERCAPGYFGDAITAKDCQPCVCDKCGTRECDHYSGQCHCHDNIVGEKCDRCADQHYGFTKCQGCTPCKCDIASESLQCDDTTGHCRCKEGVFRKTCDQCTPGFWNYSSNGCISCGCNTGYSIGMGCNAKTGLCECLSGVIGEKCDSCPYRNVLIPNEGCLACDNCTHGLLDVTDEIRRDFDPILREFKTETIGFFTARRLKYINDFFEQLAPNITDIVSFQFDVSPYEKNISIVEGEAANVHRNVLSVYTDAAGSQEKGNSAFDQAQKVDSLANRVADMARTTVFKITGLGYSLETSAGPQIDYAVQEAQQNLIGINNLDLDEEKKTEVNDVVAKANQTLQNSLTFVSPVNGTISSLNTVKNKLDKFVEKLEELDSHTEKAQKTAIDTTAINEKHKKANLLERVKSLVDITADANKTLQEVSSLLKNTSNDIDATQTNFAELAVSNSNIKDAESRANTNVEMLKNNLRTASDEVRRASEHATELENQAKILQDQKSVSSKHAVEAATSYKNIVSALDDARNLTDSAKQDADNSDAASQGLADRIHVSQQKSTDVREKARNTLNDVELKLQPELEAILELEKNVSALINQTENSINNVNKLLIEPTDPNNLNDKLKNLNADDVSTKAKDALSSIENIALSLPKKLEEAKKLYESRHSKKKASTEAGDFADKTESQIPVIQEYIDKLKDKPGNVNKTINNINDTVEMLQEKISMAKDLAAKINVGVTLHPNTVLELPIPSSLLDQGSSTDISLYFKTDQPNALLLYIGNEVGNPRQKRDASKMRRSKSDDYIAIEIENGFVVLTADIGEKQISQLVVNEPYVANNMWYNVRVERIGKTINLTVIAETTGVQKQARKHSVSGETTGSHFVLNLDKDNSKFFIGGLPPTFSAPPSVRNTFNGQVEDLTIDGVPIGLWNFVKIHTPLGVAPSKIVNGSIERDVLRKTESSTGCRFIGDGYVKLSARGYLSTSQTDIVLQFKTISSDGLLFLTHKNDIFVSIELRAGYIYYQYNVGKGIVSLHTPLTYNNDSWHTIEAKRYQHDALLRVDGKEIQKETAPDLQNKQPEFELPEYIYIGGFSGDHKIGEVTKMSFEGCIDGFQINSEAVDINKNLNAHGVIPGCPERFSKFVSFNEGDHGYIQWPRENLRLNFSNTYNIELTFRIKTKAKDGLIAYGKGGDMSFSLLMSDGSIVFRSYKSEVNTGPNMKYNDDRWHAIMAFHDANSLHLLIDDFDMFKSAEITRQNFYSLPGKLFFGSVPSDIDKTAAFEMPFNGCIGDATFNGVVINFDEIAEGKDAAIGRCSGPGQQIRPSHPTEKPSNSGITSTTISEISTATESMFPEAPVTVAPGCLPLKPATDNDISVESGFRFGTRKQSAQTYAFNSLQYQGSVEFSVEIKTISSDGIMFYVTQPQNKDFLALYVKDSKLHFKYSCSGEGGILVSAVNVNEGEWHKIQMAVSESQTRLWIDEQDESGVSGNGCKSLNIASPHYIGGADAIALETAKNHLEGFNKTFVGCLRNFKQNGQTVSGPSTSIGVIPCSNKVEKGTYFPRDGGFLKAYEHFKVGRNIDLRMEIKPRNISGLLMAVHAKRDYLVLQINDGSINFTVENGNGPVSTIFRPSTPDYFCDGQWHSIIATKTKNIIILTVDEKQVNPYGIDNGLSSVTDTQHPLYIGGYPSTITKSPGILVSNTQYIGCIRNLKINNEPQDLSSFTPHGDVMFNVCPTI